MAASLEATLIMVWRQVMVEAAKTVSVEGWDFPVRRTSRWARLAREGKKVMQLLSGRRYTAVVVDGRVQFYGKAKAG